MAHNVKTILYSIRCMIYDLFYDNIKLVSNYSIIIVIVANTWHVQNNEQFKYFFLRKSDTFSIEYRLYYINITIIITVYHYIAGGLRERERIIFKPTEIFHQYFNKYFLKSNFSVLKYFFILYIKKIWPFFIYFFIEKVLYLDRPTPVS